MILGLLGSGWGMFKPAAKPLEWIAFSAETLKAATSSGQDTVVEFTADWCLNCKTVEYLVFQDRSVVKALKDRKVNLLKADMTEGGEFADRELKRLSGQSGIPFTVVLKANGRKVLLQGIYKPEELLKALGG